MTVAARRQEILDAMRMAVPALRVHVGALAYAEASALALLFEEQAATLARIEANVTPVHADEAGLTAWAAALEVPRKGATSARKTAALLCTGTSGSAIAEGSTLEHSSGLRFSISEAATVASDGTVRASLESIDTGSGARLAANEALTFETPPTGVNQTARLVLDLDEGGTDQEELGAWRDRVTNVWRSKRQGGSRADYETWAGEVDWVDRAYVYPKRPTRGHLGVAGLKAGSGTVRLPTSAERTALDDALDELRPATDDLHVATVTARRVHIAMRLSMAPGFGLDWTGSESLTVQTYDSTTRTLTLQESALPSDLSVGDYVALSEASPGDTSGFGRPAQVSATGSVASGTYAGQAYLVLAPLVGSDPVQYTPSAGDLVYASSVTHYEAWLAVRAFFDALGPANPGQVYGEWTADVTMDRLRIVALSVASVLSVVLDSPTSDANAVASEWPSTDLELLVPGQVIVR